MDNGLWGVETETSLEERKKHQWPRSQRFGRRRPDLGHSMSVPRTAGEQMRRLRACRILAPTPG